jgi:hypothetical protein
MRGGSRQSYQLTNLQPYGLYLCVKAAELTTPGIIHFGN